MPRLNYQPWSEEEDSNLIDLWQRYKNPDVIADLMGRSRASIKHRLSKKGCVHRQRPHKWRTSEEKLLKKMVVEGKSPWEVEEALNELAEKKGWQERRSLSAIYTKSARLQISFAEIQEDTESLSANSLSIALGLGRDKFAEILKVKEFAAILKPKKGGSNAANSPQLIRISNFRKFCQVYPGEVAKLKPDVLGLLSLIL